MSDFEAAFKVILTQAESIEDPVQACSVVATQLELMRSFANKEAMKSMCHAAMTMYASERYRGVEHLLRIFALLVENSKNMGIAIYSKIDEDGFYRRSLKFYLNWAEAVCTRKGEKDESDFRKVWSLARERLSNQGLVDAEFREIAQKAFPSVTQWFDDEEEEKTMNLFVPRPGGRKARRSSVAFFEKAAQPLAPAKPLTTAIKALHFGRKENPLRKVFIDRDADKYDGIAFEEYRTAQMDDLADMDISQAPIEAGEDGDAMDISNVPVPVQRGKHWLLKVVEEEEEEDESCLILFDSHPNLMAVGRENVAPSPQSKKARTQSPAATPASKGPLRPKQTEPSPSAAVHTSFTSNFYSKAMSAFSETMAPEVEAEERAAEAESIKVLPDSIVDPDGTFQVHQDPPTPASSKEFSIFLDEPASGQQSVPPPSLPVSVPAQEENPPVDLDLSPIALTSAPPRRPAPRFSDHFDFADDDEMTVAANSGRKGVAGIVTSTPADLSPANEANESEKTANDTFKVDEAPLAPIFEDNPRLSLAPSEGGGAFARKRKSFGGPQAAMGLGVAGDKARSSILPLQSKVTDGKAIEQVMQGMSLASPTEGGGKAEKSRADSPPSEPINPWDRELRSKIMTRLASTPVNQHNLGGQHSKLKQGQTIDLGGESFWIGHEIGAGNFATVYLVTDEAGKQMALKWETPSCQWEVYVLECLRKRLRLPATVHSLMQVTDAYIFNNCSMILSEYVPHGNLLDASNKMPDPHWSMTVFLAIQMARVLKDVHAAHIVHADAKPDNWMVLQKIDEDADLNTLLETRVLRLIDWGRAIDMVCLGGIQLKGRAGTEQFDCVEMCTDRPWTYQPDYYAFIACINVLQLNKYMNVTPINGRWMPTTQFKKRLSSSQMFKEIFDEVLNIPDCDSLPSWDSIIGRLTSFFAENFTKTDWKDAVRRFNKAISS